MSGVSGGAPEGQREESAEPTQQGQTQTHHQVPDEWQGQVHGHEGQLVRFALGCIDYISMSLLFHSLAIYIIHSSI